MTCPDFLATVDPDHVTLSTTGAANLTLHVERLRGFAGAVRIVVTAPADITAEPAEVTLPAGDGATDLLFTLSTLRAEPAETAVVRVTLTSGELIHQLAFGAQIVAPTGNITGVTVTSLDGQVVYPGTDVPFGRRVRLVVHGTSLLGVIPATVRVAGAEATVVPEDTPPPASRSW